MVTGQVLPAKDDAMPAWLTISDVATLLKVSERTIQRLISSAAGKDRLLAARFGSVTRIRKETLDRWLRARESAA